MNCQCGKKHLFEDCMIGARRQDRFHILRKDGEVFICEHCCQRFTVASLQAANALMIEELQRQIQNLETRIRRQVPLLILYRPYIWK